MLGQGFRRENELPENNSVVIFSYGLWQRRFHSDPEIIGKAVTLSGRPFTILGVMPQAFSAASEEQLWLPLQLAIASNDNNYSSISSRYIINTSANSYDAQYEYGYRQYVQL